MKSVIKKAIALLTCVTAFGSCIQPIYAENEFDIVVYVSVDGSENADGTIERPFGSLEQARDAVRDMRKASKKDLSVKVILRGGIYEIDNSFRLTEDDSGTAEKPTVYTSYPGEEVRLTGAKRINHKVEPEEKILERLPEESRDKVLAFDLKKDNLDGIVKFEQRYYSVPYNPPPDILWDGEFCNVARWPNEGYAKTGTILYAGFSLFTSGGEGRPHPRDDDVGFVFKSDAPNVEKWINAKDDAWLFGYWQNGWATDSVRIKHISGNSVFTKTSASFGVRRGGDYQIYNLPEELDIPGEWYINDKSGILYIYPESEYTPETEISMAMLNEPIINVTDCSYLLIERLTLEAGMNNGINVSGGDHVRVAGCDLRQFSKHAVEMRDTKESGVLSCDIEQIGAYGIYIVSGKGNRSTLEPVGCYAVNNHVQDFGRIERTYYPGISMEGVGNYIAYNKIHNAPHMALRAEGNNNIIEFNEIYDVVKETKDAGAFYTCRDQLAFGNIMRYNYYHDIYGGTGDAGGSAVGFYVDDVGCAWTCFGNVFYKVDHPVLIGGGSNNKVLNNLIIDAPEGSEVSISLDRRDSWGNVMDYATYSLNFDYKNDIWQKYYPEAYNIRETLLNDGVVLPRNNMIKNNIIYNHAETEIAEIAVELGTVENNIVTTEDIGLKDEENNVFSLKADSPVYKMIPEFEPIPFERIGLYNDQYRNDANE